MKSNTFEKVKDSLPWSVKPGKGTSNALRETSIFEKAKAFLLSPVDLWLLLDVSALYMFSLLFNRWMQRGIQEFVHSGQLKLAGHDSKRIPGSSDSPFVYKGSLLSTSISIQQALNEDGGVLLDVSDFLCSKDGERFLRAAHKGMRPQCFFLRASCVEKMISSTLHFGTVVY